MSNYPYLARTHTHNRAWYCNVSPSKVLSGGKEQSDASASQTYDKLVLFLFPIFVSIYKQTGFFFQFT